MESEPMINLLRTHFERVNAFLNTRNCFEVLTKRSSVKENIGGKSDETSQLFANVLIKSKDYNSDDELEISTGNVATNSSISQEDNSSQFDLQTTAIQIQTSNERLSEFSVQTAKDELTSCKSTECCPVCVDKSETSDLTSVASAPKESPQYTHVLSSSNFEEELEKYNNDSKLNQFLSCISRTDDIKYFNPPGLHVYDADLDDCVEKPECELVNKKSSSSMEEIKPLNISDFKQDLYFDDLPLKTMLMDDDVLDSAYQSMFGDYIAENKLRQYLEEMRCTNTLIELDDDSNHELGTSFTGTDVRNHFLNLNHLKIQKEMSKKIGDLYQK